MGGAGALIEVADSACRVLQTVSATTDKDSGKFMANDGTPVPW